MSWLLVPPNALWIARRYWLPGILAWAMLLTIGS